MVELTPIGTVWSPVAEAVDERWGQVIAEIHLDGALIAGTQGLEAFSHVLVVYLMHEATFDPGRDLVRRPRGRDDMPDVGIFAQRTRHRPNPIGVSVVRLLAVAGGTVRVQGLDAIDGTPVLDLKPYVPVFDRIPDARTPIWMDRLMEGYF